MKEKNKLKKMIYYSNRLNAMRIKGGKNSGTKRVQDYCSMLVFMEQWRLWTTLSPNMFLLPPSMPSLTPCVYVMFLNRLCHRST